MSSFWEKENYPEKGGWFIGLRWMAVAGGLVIVLAAPYLVSVDFQYGKLLGVLLFLGSLNAVYLWYWNWLRRKGLSQPEVARKTDHFLHAQMGVDIFILTLLLFISGGSNNPLVFFYLFHLAIGAILFNRSESLPYAFAAIAAPWLLYWVGPFTNPSQNLWKGLTEFQPEHQKAILMAYSMTVAGLWFFLSRLASDIRSKERKLVEATDQLLEANEKLQQLDVYKNHFLKQVVTQLKTPVMDIDFDLSGLEKGLSDENVKQVLTVQSAKKRIWSFLSMIDDLTWLSKVEARDVPFKKEWINVYETLLKKIQEMEGEAVKKGVTFKLHGDSQVRLKVDREAFERVAGNLLSNAVKYTPEGIHSVIVELLLEPEGLMMAVDDEGIGIPPKQQEKIFQEFFRATNAKTAEKFGTGLGLTIVKRILDWHGGKIEVHSRPKEGTRVETWWPHSAA